MVRMTVSLKIILCFFPILFLCLMIFQTRSFSDEVGIYAEFQRSLINRFFPLVRDWYSFESIIAYVVLFCCRD